MLDIPQFLTIGHITQDLHSDGSFSLGGTVTFAALTAYRLGLAAGIVTCADPLLSSQLSTYLPNIALHIQPSVETTTFANHYKDGFRTQYLHARGENIQLTDVSEAWCKASIILLAPLAQEFTLTGEFARLFPRRPGGIICATPQGWLRRWDADGRVWPAPWHEAEQVLPLLDVLILSHDDLLPFANGDRSQADAMLTRWSMQVPILVATDGRYGATLFRHGTPQRFSAYPAPEVDPTGAGDVFAAAFLTHLHRHHNPEQAVDFANCVASFSIEQVGIEGIPTMQMVKTRIRTATQ